MKHLKLWENYSKSNIKLKNEEIYLSDIDLENEQSFVSGHKYWIVDYAIYKGKKFEKGVVFKYTDDDNYYEGVINRIIVTEDGSVQVSFDAPLGRVNLDDYDFDVLD